MRIGRELPVKGLTAPLEGDVLITLEYPNIVITSQTVSTDKTVFPINFLRGYGQTDNLFVFEAGRRCPYGPKKFAFNVPDHISIPTMINAAKAVHTSPEPQGRKKSLFSRVLKRDDSKSRRTTMSSGMAFHHMGDVVMTSTTDSHHRRSSQPVNFEFIQKEQEQKRQMTAIARERLSVSPLSARKPHNIRPKPMSASDAAKEAEKTIADVQDDIAQMVADMSLN
jgi:hypothetical protein